MRSSNGGLSLPLFTLARSGCWQARREMHFRLGNFLHAELPFPWFISCERLWISSSAGALLLVDCELLAPHQTAS